MKKTILILLMLTMIPVALGVIGVSSPTPDSLELTSGEQGRIRWAVQAVSETRDLKCSVVVENINPALKVAYDDGNDFVVKAGTVKPMLATVTAVLGLADGKYEQDFCVECEKIGGDSGISVEPRFCTSKIVVDVVTVRTRENFPIPEKPLPPESSFGTYAGIALGVIVILALLVIFALKRKKGGKKTKKKKHR